MGGFGVGEHISQEVPCGVSAARGGRDPGGEPPVSVGVEGCVLGERVVGRTIGMPVGRVVGSMRG